MIRATRTLVRDRPPVTEGGTSLRRSVIVVRLLAPADVDNDLFTELAALAIHQLGASATSVERFVALPKNRSAAVDPSVAVIAVSTGITVSIGPEHDAHCFGFDDAPMPDEAMAGVRVTGDPEIHGVFVGHHNGS